MIINNLTTEDIKFLKELKHELNTQSSRMTANPRMYQVRHEKFRPDVNSEGNYFEAVYEGESLGIFEYVFNNSFLTEKACREHIECNRHHYRNPVDYLNYAFRNPEMEKLLRILSKIEIKEES